MAIIKDTGYAGLMAWVWAAGWPQLIGEVRDLGLPIPNMHSHTHTHTRTCTHMHMRTHTLASLGGTQSPQPFSLPPCHPTTHFLSLLQESGKF